MADFGELGFPDLKSLKVPDSADIVVNGQPTETFLHFLNDLAAGFEALRSYTEPEAQEIPDQVLVQEKHTADGTGDSTQQDIPNDNTIPQITEGAQHQTLNFTPIRADSKIVLEWTGSASGETEMTVALFVDGTSDCLDAVYVYPDSARTQRITLRAVLDSWGTTTKTVSIRFGSHDNSNTAVVWLGSIVIGANELGGSMKSTLSAREYKNPA